MADADRDGWLLRAACRSSDIDFFDEAQFDAALALCAICPVVGPCRRLGLSEAGGSGGVWGGLTPTERRREARRLAIQARRRVETRGA